MAKLENIEKEKLEARLKELEAAEEAASQEVDSTEEAAEEVEIDSSEDNSEEPSVNVESSEDIVNLVKEIKETSNKEKEILKNQYEEQIRKLVEKNKEKEIEKMTKEEKAKELQKQKIRQENQEKQDLINRIKTLEKEAEKAKNEEFISKKISEKPYLRDEINRVGISNPKEYNKYIKPLEARFERLYKLEKSNKEKNKNAFGRYKFNDEKNNKGNKKVDQAKKLAEGILGDI